MHKDNTRKYFPLPPSADVDGIVFIRAILIMWYDDESRDESAYYVVDEILYRKWYHSSGIWTVCSSNWACLACSSSGNTHGHLSAVQYLEKYTHTTLPILLSSAQNIVIISLGCWRPLSRAMEDSERFSQSACLNILVIPIKPARKSVYKSSFQSLSSFKQIKGSEVPGFCEFSVPSRAFTEILLNSNISPSAALTY